MSAFRYYVIRYADGEIVSVHDTLNEAKRASAQMGGGMIAKSRDELAVGTRYAPAEPASPGRPTIGAPLTVRLTEEDRVRLGEIRARHALSSDAEAVRWAIRHATAPG